MPIYTKKYISPLKCFLICSLFLTLSNYTISIFIMGVRGTLKEVKGLGYAGMKSTRNVARWNTEIWSFSSWTTKLLLRPSDPCTLPRNGQNDVSKISNVIFNCVSTSVSLNVRFCAFHENKETQTSYNNREPGRAIITCGPVCQFFFTTNLFALGNRLGMQPDFQSIFLDWAD